MGCTVVQDCKQAKEKMCHKIPHKIHAINLCFPLPPLNKPLVHITVLSVLPVMSPMKELGTLVHSGSFTSDTLMAAAG